MNDARRIQDVLDRVKTRFRWLTIASVAAGLAAVLLLALAVEVAIDQLFPLPRWIRVLVFLGGAGASGWLAWRFLSGPLAGRVSDLYLARSIEGQYAGLKSGLITYVQLSGEGEESAALRELVGERVAEEIDDVRPEVVVPSRDARRRSLLLGGAVAACLLLIAISPSGFWLSFQRSLLPIRNLTETRIEEVVPGNATAAKGKDVEIAVRVSGKRPPAAQVRVCRDSGDPVTVVLPPRADGWYRGVLPGVAESFRYSLRANDASSDEYRVRVVDVPRLKSIAATLQFPGYTGFPARKQDSGNLDAIEGTQVTLEGTATRPLGSATLVLKDKRIPSSALSGERFGFRFPLTETQDYTIELADREGVADPEPSRFRAVVRKDTPPQVTVTVPGKNVELPAPGKVTLACRVVDDFGITALRLTAKINGKIPKVLALPFPKERLFVCETALDLNALGVGAGDYIEYFLTATDNKEPAPQTGQSPSYIITVQSSLPLLTFADAHPDVRVEKYRDPLDRKGAVEPRTEKLLAEDRTRDPGKTQEPPLREQAKRDVQKTDEKKPEAKKDDPANAAPQRSEADAGREDAMAKLLEEKKDLIERLLAKAGMKDGAGDARNTARDGAGSREGDARDDAADPGKGDDKTGASDDSAGLQADKSGEMARKGDSRKTGKEGSRAGKNAGRGEGKDAGDGDGAGGDGDEAPAGEPGYDPSEGTPGQKAGTPGAKAGARGAGKTGRPGKPGRPGAEGDGDSDGDSDGDDGDDGDGDDDYDLSYLFPFDAPGGS